MEMHLKYDINLACRVLLKEQLEKLSIPYHLTNEGKVEIKGEVSAEKANKLEAGLKKYGIELIDNSKNILVQKIQDAVHEIVYRNNKPSQIKLSDFISDKLNLSYSYLSKVFSEETGTSIENYMIMHRVERVKQLIIENSFTVTEIAWILNYSSVAHLSNQFKKTTGITPTFYQRIIRKNSRKTLQRERKHESQIFRKSELLKDVIL